MKRLLSILLFLSVFPVSHLFGSELDFRSVFPVPHLIGSELDFSKAEICSGLLSGLIVSAKTLETDILGIDWRSDFSLRNYYGVRHTQLTLFSKELDRFSSRQNHTPFLPAHSLIENLRQIQSTDPDYISHRYWSSTVPYQSELLHSLAKHLVEWKQKLPLLTKPFEYHPLLAQLWGLESGLKALSQNHPDCYYLEQEWQRNSAMANVYGRELSQVADSLTDPRMKSELYGIIQEVVKVRSLVKKGSAYGSWGEQIRIQTETFKTALKMLDALNARYSAELRQMETPSGIFFPGQQVLLRETMNPYEVDEVHPREQALILKEAGFPLRTVSHDQVIPTLKQFVITQADGREVPFLEGDLLSFNSERTPTEGTIKQILVGGTAIIEIEGKGTPKTIPLADTVNLSHSNRLAHQKLSSDLIPLWNQYQPKLRSDTSRYASEFGTSLSSLLERSPQLTIHDVSSWKNQRRIAKKLLLDYPEIPGDLKSKIIDSFGLPLHSDNPPKTETTGHDLFYRESEKYMIDYAMNPVIERIRALFGERLNKRMGPRMSRLNDLVKWSENPSSKDSPEKKLFDQKRGWRNWYSSRDTLDWVGHVLLEEFPELPIDIRIRIPGFLREARTIDMIHSGERPKFPEGSLLPSPENEKTRRILVDPLVIELKRNYLTGVFPKNSRVTRLRELTDALESVEKTEALTTIEDPEKALKTLAEVIFSEFPDLKPEELSKIRLLIPNSASELPKNPNKLPIVLDTNTLKQIQIVQEIMQSLSDFRFDLLHNSLRGNDFRKLTSLLKDLSNSEQTLLESMALFNLTESPDTYEVLHEKIAEKIIIEFPEFSPSLRKEFLKLISNPSGELTTAANAMPKTSSNSAHLPLFPNTLEPASETSFKPEALESAESLAFFRHLGGWLRGKGTLTPILILGPGSATNTWIAVSQKDFDNALGVQNQLDLFQLQQKDLVVSPHPSPDLGGAEIGTNDTLKTKAPRLTTVLIPPNLKAQIHNNDLQTRRKILREFLHKSLK